MVTEDPTAGKRMIALTGVSKWFDSFQVLKGIDLVVGRGERVVVCGPSGRANRP